MANEGLAKTGHVDGLLRQLVDNQHRPLRRERGVRTLTLKTAKQTAPPPMDRCHLPTTLPHYRPCSCATICAHSFAATNGFVMYLAVSSLIASASSAGASWLGTETTGTCIRLALDLSCSYTSAPRHSRKIRVKHYEVGRQLIRNSERGFA